MIDKKKYFDFPVPDLSNGIDIYYFCEGMMGFCKGMTAEERASNYNYTIGDKNFYIRRISIFEIIVTPDGWTPAVGYDGKDFDDIDLRHSENVLVEYPFTKLMHFEPMRRYYFLSLNEAKQTAEYLMELERKKKNEKED